MSVVLVVDDRPINREFLATLLDYAGHVVIEAADGSEALLLARRQCPDLIITDLMMPVMDGLELTRQLRADPATQRIPILFYTATYRMQEARELARSYGVDAVLRKPTEPQVILDTVARILGTAALAPTPAMPEITAAVVVKVGEAPGLKRHIRDALALATDADVAMVAPASVVDHTRRDAAAALSLRLAAVLELGLNLGAERDTQQLLRLFCRAAQDIMGARYSSVLLADRQSNRALDWAAEGLSEEQVAALGSVDFSHAFIARLLRGNEPVHALDLGGDPRSAGLPDSHPAVNHLIGVPLDATGTRGVLYFADKIGGTAFDDEDTQLAATLAAQVALAYGNLRLYAQLQQHAGELRIEVLERKRVAEHLHESEARFRQVLDNLREVVFLFDPITRTTLYVSPAYETLWQQSRQSLYDDATTWTARIHPDDRARADASWTQGIATGLIDNRYRIVRLDGSIRWVHVRGFPVCDTGGQLIRIVGIAEDETDRLQAQQAVASSEHRYRQLFDANPMPLWVYDLHSLRFLAVNDAAIEHYGYSRQQFLGMTIAQIRPEDEIERLGEHLQTERPQIDHAGIWRHRKADGTIISVQITSHTLDFSGTQARLVLINDVTVQQQQDLRIARLTRIRAVIGAIHSAMLRLSDRTLLLQEACRVAATEGVFPMAWVSVVDPLTGDSEVLAAHGGDPALVDAIRQAARETLHDSTRIKDRQSGQSHAVVVNDLLTEPGAAALRAQLLDCGYRSVAAFPLFVEQKVVAILVLLAGERNFFDAQEIALLEWLTADLSFALDHIEKSRRLDYLAYYDELTGLPNARLFHDRLGQFIHAAQQERGKVCVLVLDLQHFTQINESCGRSVGDELLRQVSSRLAQALVEPYTLGRISADTFAAATPRDAGHAATHLRDRLFEAMEDPFQIAGRSLQVSMQAGIALFPADGDSDAGVFKNAETALKLAKSSGQRCVYFSTELNERIARRLELERQLQAAVAQQEFVLYYQPRVDMISGELLGAEALIRWQHPARGLLTPGEFIQLAEETGLIVAIGAWVMQTVCTQQSVWIAGGLTAVPIAVNLSSVQFEKGDLLGTVADALRSAQLEPRLLELELTESAVMSDPAAATETLRALRKLGVGLALDDFGTGYSSLAHLKRFPFDSVKIDRSFVTDITTNPEDAAIACAIIAMAHRLQLKVVAEGVETLGQFNYLRSQGCDQMQGHYFAAAMATADFEAQLRSGRHMPLPQRPTTDLRTLLIVDDESGIRAALNRMLRRDGYRILLADSGLQGLQMLAENAVQVIISDQRMPGMSGTEFLDTVRQLYPSTVRIILSGYTDLDVVTDAVNRGAVFKFLTKPWDDDLLREQVRDAFRRHRPD